MPGPLFEVLKTCFLCLHYYLASINERVAGMPQCLQYANKVRQEKKRKGKEREKEAKERRKK